MNRDGELKIRIDDSDWQRLANVTSERTSDWRPAARRIHTEMKVRVDSMFARLRHGGTHRGVTWRYFAPQYTRKDGTVVPAWGGVKKVRGSGYVQGRKRPSGARVRSGDSIMQDTVHLRRAALLSRRLNLTRLVMGPASVNYADKQAAMRPFAFFHLPTDLEMARERVLDFFMNG